MVHLHHSFTLLLVNNVEYNNCSNGEVRLTGGSSPLNGRTEICYGNVWFGICYDRWYYYSHGAAKIACSSVGYSQRCEYSTMLIFNIYIALCYSLFVLYLAPFICFITLVGTASYGTYFDLPSLPFFPYELSCVGTEVSLLDCYKYTLSCSNSNGYAASTCQGNVYPVCWSGSISLNTQV